MSRAYSGSEFHQAIVDLFKRCALKLDFDMNPLEWDQLPYEVGVIVDMALKDAFKDQDYPIEYIGYDRSGELEIGAYIDWLDVGGDIGTAHSSMCFSDKLISQVIHDGDDGKGFLELIDAAERSIAIAKEKATAKGWL